ncbi:alpha-amylase family glycosyl hydrolase [Fictibacillus enclensis]|uniref:alpha-amylase family glycosyl hydrolase n=1 Tax=Fictibacillus enclensis TaxID=1017270 RepID=UPI0024BFC04E|nr:alpha-amylase family glycosyl hydrolase [Fictibacillus enclensis]WHY73061.1 alpha-amylase family glycosyl hydrolase [Fictibacillus enclensis]
MKKSFGILMSLVLLLGIILVQLPQTAAAASYQKVVVRGSLAPLDWGTDNNPLTLQQDGTWKSNPIPLTGGNKLEFKYVRDDQWMDGSNLEFVPPQTGSYVFVFHPDDERKVDIQLVEGKGKVTLNVTVPASTPDWADVTIGTSLNKYNYSLTSLKKTGDKTYSIQLTGEPGQSFSYLYALGDAKYKEAKSEPRKATFTEAGQTVSDTVENWSAVPVAKRVTHDFNYQPFIPDHRDKVTVKTTVEHYGPINKGGIYYTTDGSTPVGKRGLAKIGRFAPMYVSSKVSLGNGLYKSVLTGVIPKQKNDTRVKYKVDVWDTEGTGSQFADTNSILSADATEFAYYVDDYKSPQWAKNASIYHVFVDRFKDGNLLNNEPVDPNLSYDEKLKNWMGGDLQGVKDKISYIKNLGVNAIWISPVFKGPYFHGYHPADFLKIDPRFGNNKLMKEIIKEAHKNGMKVVYDLVPNHTSNQHPFFQDAVKNGTKSPYYNWYTFTNWPNEYKTFYGVTELPELNNDNPATRSYMMNKVVPFWLNDLGFDGFRLDYAKGPSYSFWVDFRHTVKKLKPNAFIYGEVWDSREKINTYAGKLDGALDFPMQNALLDVFAKGQSMQELSDAIRLNQSTYDPQYVMGTFLDNHDMPRFLFESKGDVNKLKQAAAAQFTLPGAPIIYYGTEVGLSQSKDQTTVDEYQDRYYREPMPWDKAKQNLELKKYYKQLIKLRNDEPALRTGKIKEWYSDDHVLVYERSNKQDRFLVVLNTGGNENITLKKSLDKGHELVLKNVWDKKDIIHPGKKDDLKISSKAGGVQIYEMVKGKKYSKKKAS